MSVLQSSVNGARPGPSALNGRPAPAGPAPESSPANASTAVPIAGMDLSRLTVRGVRSQCDVALPSSATVGEIVPLLLRLTEPQAEEDADREWVLQRLGGPPFDPDDTPEKLDLRDGEVLYFNPAEAALPELVFDDVGAAVADEVRGLADFWRPAFTRAALLAAGCAALLGYGTAALGVHPVADRSAWFIGAAAVLTVAAVVVGRVLRDRILGTVCGLAGCGFAAAAGLAARQGTAARLPLDHRTLLLVAAGVVVPAALCACAGRLPVTLFGALAGTALCALAGTGLESWLRLPAVRAAAILAVLLFALTNTGLRAALRAARLRVSQLPRTALELQEDIEPVPAALVAARAAAMVRYANVLFLSCSAVWLGTLILLAGTPGWAPRALTLVFCLAVLLRSQTVSPAWQRGAMLACAVTGLLVAAARWLSVAGPAAHTVALPALALAAAGLLAAARRAPGRRMLPIWGQFSDLLELWTAIAMVPLVLQVFHAYSYFRTLIN